MTYMNRYVKRVVKRPSLACAGHFTEEVDYTRYKYALNLPGSTHGSYSRNLNHLWALGGVLLQWRMDAKESDSGSTHFG